MTNETTHRIRDVAIQVGIGIVLIVFALVVVRALLSTIDIYSYPTDAEAIPNQIEEQDELGDDFIIMPRPFHPFFF